MSGREVVVVLEAPRHLSETDRALVEIFCSRLSIAFDNVILYEQLQESNARLEERVTQRTQDLMSANRRLAAQWSRLRQANNFKSEILGTVAHDLKNPLAVILGRTEILKEMIGGSDRPNMPAQIDYIRNAAKQLTEMVDDLVSDAMTDALDISVRREAIDLAILVEEVADANRPLAERKNQVLTVNAPREHTAMCDADRVRDAIDNLVSNAIKYSPIGGAIDVVVGRDGDSIMVQVKDQGAGLSPEDISRSVRTLSAAVRQADRRRKLDRSRPVDRQAHRRPARRPDHGRKRRAGRRCNLHHDVAGRHEPVAAHRHRRRRAAGPRNGRRLSAHARLQREPLRRRREPAHDHRPADAGPDRPRSQHAGRRRTVDHPRPQEADERADHHADRDRERDRPRGRAGAGGRRLPGQALRTARTAGAHPCGAQAQRRRPASCRPACPDHVTGAGPQARAVRHQMARSRTRRSCGTTKGTNIP